MKVDRGLRPHEVIEVARDLDRRAVAMRIEAATARAPLRASLREPLPEEITIGDVLRDETPARRGRFPRGHGSCSVNSRTSPLDQSTRGVGASRWSVRGSSPCRIASAILITPATPAAATV